MTSAKLKKPVVSVDPANANDVYNFSTEKMAFKIDWPDKRVATKVLKAFEQLFSDNPSLGLCDLEEHCAKHRRTLQFAWLARNHYSVVKTLSRRFELNPSVVLEILALSIGKTSVEHTKYVQERIIALHFAIGLSPNLVWSLATQLLLANARSERDQYWEHHKKNAQDVIVAASANLERVFDEEIIRMEKEVQRGVYDVRRADSVNANNVNHQTSRRARRFVVESFDLYANQGHSGFRSKAKFAEHMRAVVKEKFSYSVSVETVANTWLRGKRISRPL